MAKFLTIDEAIAVSRIFKAQCELSIAGKLPLSVPNKTWAEVIKQLDDEIIQLEDDREKARTQYFRKEDMIDVVNKLEAHMRAESDGELDTQYALEKLQICKFKLESADGTISFDQLDLPHISYKFNLADGLETVFKNSSVISSSRPQSA